MILRQLYGGYSVMKTVLTDQSKAVNPRASPDTAMEVIGQNMLK